MKTRESGMPEQGQWESFFDPSAVLDRLRLHSGVGNVVEFGCGYGTFTLEAALRATGLVFAFDIDPEMVVTTANRVQQRGCRNVLASLRDFVDLGTGLPDGQMDYAMLFNILHAETPQALLGEAWRLLRPGGVLGVMHWNYDSSTPRGPSMAIRPRPDECRNWAIEVGFRLLPPGILDLPPHHYGMALEKPATQS
jgi:SAM-dependent methyltransferase